MEVVHIRRLVPGDLPAYRPLMLAAYERHPDAFTSSAAERAALPMAWWEARLRDEPLAVELVLGAFEGPSLVGAAGVSFETREKARHKATLFGMYVPPEHRHKGIGHGLVVAALAHARGRSGVRLVQLTVTDGNAPAVALYERCGFVAFGLEPLAVAVGEGYVSKLHMWCDLVVEARS
jgi:ribosomal protein S18 acetylase RimI-like enzyme